MNARLGLYLFLLVGIAAVPRAQSQPMTVYDALSRVETEHPAIGSVEAAMGINSGQRLLGFGIDVPTFQYAREGMAGTAYNEQRFVLGQAIASPVATYYGLRRISTERDALRSSLDARRTALRAGVKKAYVDVMFAERILQLRTRSVELSEQLLEAAQLRESAGESAGLETMRAEIGLAEAEAALVEAERASSEARTYVGAATALGTNVDVVSPGPLDYLPVRLSRADALGSIEALPVVRQSEQSVMAARLGVQEARGALFPGAAFEVFPQDFGDGFNHWGFAVGLRLPLPGTPAYRGARAVARATLQQRQYESQATLATVSAEAELAWAGYEKSLEEVLRYRDRIAPQADTLVERSQEGYLIGEVPLFALLDAQRTALAAQERYARALQTYTHRLVDLERFTGRELVFTNEDAQTAAPTAGL